VIDAAGPGLGAVERELARRCRRRGDRATSPLATSIAVRSRRAALRPHRPSDQQRFTIGRSPLPALEPYSRPQLRRSSPSTCSRRCISSSTRCRSCADTAHDRDISSDAAWKLCRLGADTVRRGRARAHVAHLGGRAGGQRDQRHRCRSGDMDTELHRLASPTPQYRRSPIRALSRRRCCARSLLRAVVRARRPAERGRRRR